MLAKGESMSIISKASVVTITGGTGSFGFTMVKNLLAQNIEEIRIFSRDENKQDLLRNQLKDERVKFFIGDVRDSQSVDNVIRGSDYVFHAAALKQVPSCEFFPMQANLTNVVGSSNVIEAAYKFNIKSIVCLSTDKAVYPINAMGMTKALMEKVAFSYARNYPESKTRISVTRYGNVMMSRGSVIPLFLKQLKNGEPITITDPEMTRFMMSLQDSVDLVNYAFANAHSGELFVRKAPGCMVQTLVDALIEIVKPKIAPKIVKIGVRHGEKKYESLLGSEEKTRSVDEGDYFRVPLDTRTLDYHSYFDKGQPEIEVADSYTSSNTRQLSLEETVALISELPEYLSTLRN